MNLRSDENLFVGAEEDSYYSAELSIRGITTPYQFKIRRVSAWPLSVLVREDSEIVPLLQVGDIVDAKYYTIDSQHTPKRYNTAIRDITKNEQGPYRGHYLVGLEILDEPAQGMSCSNRLRVVG